MMYEFYINKSTVFEKSGDPVTSPQLSSAPLPPLSPWLNREWRLLLVKESLRNLSQLPLNLLFQEVCLLALYKQNRQTHTHKQTKINTTTACFG